MFIDFQEVKSKDKTLEYVLSVITTIKVELEKPVIQNLELDEYRARI